jgi:hypothetical protein
MENSKEIRRLLPHENSHKLTNNNNKRQKKLTTKQILEELNKNTLTDDKTKTEVIVQNQSDRKEISEVLYINQNCLKILKEKFIGIYPIIQRANEHYEDQNAIIIYEYEQECLHQNTIEINNVYLYFIKIQSSQHGVMKHMLNYMSFASVFITYRINNGIIYLTSRC